MTAATVYGAYRGLETFSQLVRWDFDLKAYRVDYLPLTIKDQPKFPFRGILIDTSRCGR
jgi:hexosaminidase